jgi:hypothetical protein
MHDVQVFQAPTVHLQRWVANVLADEFYGCHQYLHDLKDPQSEYYNDITLRCNGIPRRGGFLGQLFFFFQR